jgi:hypothetical protein
MTFTFQVTLIASIQVKADTRDESERKLRKALADSKPILGILDNELIVAAIDVEGDLDLIDAAACCDNGTATSAML